MKKIIVYIFRVLINQLYILLKLFNIKETGLLIAGYKARYMVGNCKYLFEYLIELNSEELNFYFYTKDKNEYSILNKKYPHRILYPYQLKSLIIILKSKILVLTSGYDDLSPYPLFDKKIIINTWHGIPMKKIGYLSTKNVNKYFEKFARSLNYYTVSSEYDKLLIKNAFDLNEDSVIITGLQNNDYINLPQNNILEKTPYLKEKIIILYAPTFRENEMKSISFKSIIPISELNLLMEKYDALFLYRSHFNTRDHEEIKAYPRIKYASNSDFPDAQSLLYFSDILITDYSGIFFDFLLMDRPIIFYNYDYEEYEKHRGFIMNYYENTPGPKVQTKEGLLAAIETYLKNSKIDVDDRYAIKNKFHKYTDGKACERTVELIKSLY
ncbi:MAG: CDP-glycerol glycerophosphotransferase family protein [Salinivirgaceae bacterium]|nr:CDP-glycerol glycerophosphotransferase family protein [Salinivirgaceae bacterium]